MNFICRKIADDICLNQVQPEIRIMSVAEEAEKVTINSKVSFNPDIEIASYDPKMPLAKPQQHVTKPVSGSLIKNKPLKIAQSNESSEQFLLNRVKEFLQTNRV